MSWSIEILTLDNPKRRPNTNTVQSSTRETVPWRSITEGTHKKNMKHVYTIRGFVKMNTSFTGDNENLNKMFEILKIKVSDTRIIYNPFKDKIALIRMQTMKIQQTTPSTGDHSYTYCPHLKVVYFTSVISLSVSIHWLWVIELINHFFSHWGLCLIIR